MIIDYNCNYDMIVCWYESLYIIKTYSYIMFNIIFWAPGPGPGALY